MLGRCASNNVEISRAERARRFDKFAFAHGQHLRAHQTRVADPSSERQGKNEVENARAAKGHEGDCDENAGERKNAFINTTLTKRSMPPP
jgi:hypothetical protein